MKVCPNCGNRLKGYEEFCPSCGCDLSKYRRDLSQNSRTSGLSRSSAENDLLQNSVDQFQPQAFSASSAAGSQSTHRHKVHVRSLPVSKSTKSHQLSSHLQKQAVGSTNYFSWWWRSLRDPTLNLHGSWYFGLVSFLISGLLWIFSFHSLMGQFVNSALAGWSNDQISVDNAMFENADRNWWGLITLGVLFWLCAWLIGYGFRNRSQSVNIWTYSNRLAALTNLSLPLEFVGLLLTLVKFNQIAMLIFLAAWAVDVVGLATSVLDSDQHNRFYAATLTVILVPVVVIVIFICLVQITGGV